MTRVALDSNILVYLAAVAATQADDEKIERVRELIERLNDSATLIAPVQALGELFVVMRRNGRSAEIAGAFVRQLGETCETPASTMITMRAALGLVTDHRLQYWDALILSVAADAGCTLLLSEDMQHGFAVRGVTVVNPLAAGRHPVLAALIG